MVLNQLMLDVASIPGLQSDLCSLELTKSAKLLQQEPHLSGSSCALTTSVAKPAGLFLLGTSLWRLQSPEDCNASTEPELATRLPGPCPAPPTHAGAR